MDEGKGIRNRRISRLLDGSKATRSDPKKVLYHHLVVAQTGLLMCDRGGHVRQRKG